VRHGVNKLACLVEKYSAEISQPVHFRETVTQVTQKHCNIVIRLGIGVAASTRTEQNHTLNALAVNFFHGDPVGFKNWII
jgi:hypothetical protein